MLENLYHSIIVNFSITLNSIIYFLKRMPLIKNLFKNVGYEYSDISKILFPIGLIYSVIKQLIKSILLLAFTFGIPYLISLDDTVNYNLEATYWHIFFLFYILLALISSRILEPRRRKFISVKLMRMDARSFVLADYFPPLICRQLVELIPFIFVALIYKVPLVLAIFMVIAKNFFAIFAEALQIKYYDQTGKFFHDKNVIILTYSIAIISIAYYTTFKQILLPLSEPVIIAIGIMICILGLFALSYILKYDKFSTAINDANRLDKLNIDVKSVKKNSEFSRVKFKDKEFTKEELQYNKANKKEGFHYINEIFFKRHKRILNGPIKMQLIGIFILLVGGILVSFFIPDFNQRYVKLLKQLYPVFVFVSYCMSTGQKATKAMFYNCDISLLHYGFYKTKDAVLATFTIRAKYLVMANMLPATALAAAIVLIDVITGGSVITLAPIGIMIIFLSIFFAIHNLFLYYIFQPYTTDLTVKNPFFKLLNFITYFLSYLCLQLENMSITFLIAVIAITAIYSIAALITVYKIAPRTFVIK